MICPTCSADFEPRRKNHRFCSWECLNESRRKPVVESRSCEWCGVMFEWSSSRPTRRFCSPRCRERAEGARSRRVPTLHPCPICGVDVADRWGRVFCSKRCLWMHKSRRKTARQGGGGRHRRRARHFGVAYAPINPRVIFARDGWRCGICGDPVDPKLRHPDPRSASLDHVVPMSIGGDHLPGNVQCSHLACNVTKRDQFDDEYQAGLFAVDARRRGPATCSVPGCERKHAARGLCALHYNRANRAGTLPARSSPVS